MEELIEDLANGNVTEVKVVLASVILALAVYQLLLAAVSYGWVRLPFLDSAPASWTHRASGDAGAHSVLGCVLLGVIALKVIAVRAGHHLSPLLPLIGISLLALFAATWLTSAGDFLGVG